MHPSTIPSPRLDPDERVLSWSLLRKKDSGGERHTQRRKQGGGGREGRKEGEKERRPSASASVCYVPTVPHAIHAVLALCLCSAVPLPLPLLPSTNVD